MSRKFRASLSKGGGDAADVLEFAEEAFDEISLSIDMFVHAALDPTVALGGDVGAGAPALGEIDQCLGVVTPVRDEVSGPVEAGDQSDGLLFVGGLAGGQGKADGQPFAIHHDVDLRAQSSTRTADSVIRAPFFPPAAC